LQFVFYPAADHHQLVPMQHQLPQVALLPVRSPQARKAASIPASEYAPRPASPSSACARNWPGSQPHLQSRSRAPDPRSVRGTTDCCRWPPCRSAGAPRLLIKQLGIAAGMHQLRSPQSPVSVSSHEICCQLGWKSHPIVIMRRLLSSQPLCSSKPKHTGSNPAFALSWALGCPVDRSSTVFSAGKRGTAGYLILAAEACAFFRMAICPA
jgi:hypothetical protein